MSIKFPRAMKQIKGLAAPSTRQPIEIWIQLQEITDSHHCKLFCAWSQPTKTNAIIDSKLKLEIATQVRLLPGAQLGLLWVHSGTPQLVQVFIVSYNELSLFPLITLNSLPWIGESV